MPHRLPVLLAAPPPPRGRLQLTNARVFDPSDGSVREHVRVTVDNDRIEAVEPMDAAADARATQIDVGGRTVLPGLIDVHAHLNPRAVVSEPGTEPLADGLTAHLLVAELQRTLRMGVTTLRDVGSYGDTTLRARQAMRHGAFRGPRVLTCGRIVSATAPGDRFFPGMYRQADGPDEMRKAAREQLRRGADFVKIMSTGARSVELEDPDPAQVTGPEMTALVDEVHRLGYRVASHCEGLAGTELAIRAGVDTIEHGMYLHQRPELLDAMAANGQILVPTFGCFYGVAGFGSSMGLEGTTPLDTTLRTDVDDWTPLLRDLAKFNLDQADRTLQAARSAGVPIAAGHDWYPFDGVAIEIARLHHHGLSAIEALTAATATSARAAGLEGHVGSLAPGTLADLIVVDGDPVTRPASLARRDNIWLVLQGGTPVAGAALEVELGV